MDERSEDAYLVSIHGDLAGPIASIPTTYPLDPLNLKRLWDEVATYWQTLTLSASARTSAFPMQGPE